MIDTDAPRNPPFEPGALVRIKNRLDRCIHRVAEIEWRVPRGGKCAPYWSVMAEPHAAANGEALAQDWWIGQPHMLEAVEA